MKSSSVGSNAIPYARQEINDADIESVCDVLRSDWLTQGPIGHRFECELATYCGVEFAVAVSSATAGLHLACLALGLGPGDLAWTTPISFVASSNAALYCGAKVDFVDIEPSSGNISIDALVEKLECARKLKRLPKVIIVVHYCGHPVDLARVGELADVYGFKVIEDASHAMGAMYDSDKIGACKFSDFTVFSFHPVKMITTGEGGAVMTKSRKLADRIRELRSHGIRRDLERRGSDLELWNYVQVSLGFNYRLPDINAALGLSQLRRLDDWVERRREIATHYEEKIGTLEGLETLSVNPRSLSSYHLFVIRVLTDFPLSRNGLYEHLQSRGVSCNLHYIPIYLQPYYADLGFKRGLCPRAEVLFSELLTLPMYASLTNDDLCYVISSLEV